MNKSENRAYTIGKDCGNLEVAEEVLGFLGRKMIESGNWG